MPSRLRIVPYFFVFLVILKASKRRQRARKLARRARQGIFARVCIISSYGLVCLLRKINRETTCSLALVYRNCFVQKSGKNREGGRVIFFKSIEGNVKIQELLREKRTQKSLL